MKLSKQEASLIKSIEEKWDINFNDKSLLVQALTHSSFAKQKNRQSILHNERLEFLGDAVLKLIISSYLFEKYPEFDEGLLSKKRAVFVSDRALSEIGNRLELGKFLFLSSSEKRMGGDQNSGTVANAVEAILAAIYLDSGLEKASHFFMKHFINIEETFSDFDFEDHKTRLQEWAQKNKKALPIYKIEKSEGPEHKKLFWVSVHLPESGFPDQSGSGKSKKEAEQIAAQKMSTYLK